MSEPEITYQLSLFK